MQNYILTNSMLSLATIVVLGTTGCSDDKSKTSNTDDNQEQEVIVPTTTTVLNGSIDLTDNTVTNAPAKSIARADTFYTANCGTSATVQLYAIDDIEYMTPLLKEAIDVNQTNCEFNIDDDDFIDSNLSGSNQQYLVRTLVLDGDNIIELSATKLIDGIDAGIIDPIATMITERFIVVIQEVQASMEKLASLGVTTDAIGDAIDNIITDFEKNFNDTVANLKSDIASGKITIDMNLFITTESLDKTVTEEQLAERQEKSTLITKTFQNSSASNTFTMLESSVKKQQLDYVTIDEDSLRNGLDSALAEIKYGVIESFVKIGLNVHDGNGNLIIYLPVEERRKGELPGQMYQLNYSTTVDNTTTISKVGDDFAIRIINPETDLNRLSGNEDWYRDYIQDNDVIIPSSVIDSIIIAKDHTITMQDLGKAINKSTGGDGTIDSFTDTELYTTAMNDSILTSVENIITVFKNDFLKQSFSQLMWETTDGIFTAFDNGNNQESLIADILAMPFIVQNDENTTQFLERLGEDSDSMNFLIDTLTASLSNGIPISDSNETILQFKTGTTITPDSAMKPLASIAMIDLFMQAKDSDDEGVFVKRSLNEMFGWVSDDTTLFDSTQMWSLDFDTQVLPEESDLETQVESDTNMILILMEAITGNSDINVERNFSDTLKKFSLTLQNIEKKSTDAFNFENEFKGNLIDFDSEDSMAASVHFELYDFNDVSITLSEDEQLILMPIVMNLDTYEHKTIPNFNTSVVLNTDNSYGATNLTIYNENIRFDENGTQNDNGKYIALNDFNLVLLKNDGTTKHLATFPIFPGENNLNMPFYYNEVINYGSFMDDDEDSTDDGSYTPFTEHNYLENSSDIYFPLITKNDDANVGEYILSYDVSRKIFTKKLTNGVVSDANMTISVIYKNYDDDGLNSLTVESIDLTGEIGEGAYLELELSGPQIQTQKINMNIFYIGENGEVEYELYKNQVVDDKEDYIPMEPPFVDSEIDFTSEMLTNSLLYLVTKPINPELEPYISEVEFYDDGTRAWTRDGNTTSANYAIVDGDLEIYNEDNTLLVRINIIEEYVDNAMLSVELFDANNEKIADRLIFATLGDRDLFIESYINDEYPDTTPTAPHYTNMNFIGTLPTEAGSLAGTEVTVELFENGGLFGSIGNYTIVGSVNEDGAITSQAGSLTDGDILANCTGNIDFETSLVTIDVIPVNGEPFTYTLVQTEENNSSESTNNLVLNLEDSIDTEDEIKWYSFDAIAGNSYLINWDDLYTDENYTTDITVSVYKEDEITAYYWYSDVNEENYGSSFEYEDDGDTPRYITALEDEKIMIKVKGYSSSDIGTYSLQVTSITNDIDDNETSSPIIPIEDNETAPIELVDGYDLSVVIDSVVYNSSTQDGLITYTLYNNGNENLPLESDYILGNIININFYSGLTTNYTEERSDGFGAGITFDIFMAHYKEDIFHALDAGGNIQLTRTFNGLGWHEDMYVYAKVLTEINANSEGENSEDLDTNFENNIAIKEITFE